MWSIFCRVQNDIYENETEETRLEASSAEYMCF